MYLQVAQVAKGTITVSTFVKILFAFAILANIFEVFFFDAFFIIRRSRVS